MNYKFKATLKDKVTVFAHSTLTGQREEIKCKNMILNKYLDELAGGRMFIPYSTARVYLGGSDTPEDGTSEGLKGVEIDSVMSKISQINFNDTNGGYGYIIQHNAVFAANNKTGMVKELVLTGISRLVLDTPIDKNEYTQIEVTWDIQQTLTVYSGTIPKGQSDGETDIEWELVIPYHSRNGLPALGYDNATSPQTFFSGGGNTAYLAVGTSNAPTNLSSTSYSVYGTELLKRQLTTEKFTYVKGSYERSFSVLIDAYESNGSIGEVLLYNSSGGLYPSTRLFFRITFTPPLDKSGPDPYRLRLKFTFSLSRDVID